MIDPKIRARILLASWLSQLYFASVPSGAPVTGRRRGATAGHFHFWPDFSCVPAAANCTISSGKPTMLQRIIDLADPLSRGIAMIAVAAVLLVFVAVYRRAGPRLKLLIERAEIVTGFLIGAWSVVWLIFWRE
jgi:hypothetical protein